MAEAVLFVEIVPTTKGVKRSIEGDLNGSFDAAEKKGSTVLNKLGGLAKGVGLAAAAGVTAFAGIAIAGGFSRAMKIDEAQAKLRGLGNDTEAVEKIMDNALAAVQGTSFGLDAAATTAAGAVAAGIAPGEELERVLKSVANAAAAAGTDMSDMGSIYNKVASLGKAQNDVLQQVADRGIPIYQALADQMGATADEVFKMASAGEIGFAEFESAMTSAAGTVAAEMGTTLPGLMDNMMASVSRIGEGVIMGIFPQLKDGVSGVTDVFKEWEVGAKDVGVAIGDFVAEYGPKLVDTLTKIWEAGVDVVGWIQDNVEWLAPLAAGIAGAVVAFEAWRVATQVATAVQVAFNAVMNANPIMLIVTAISALVAGLVYFFTQTELGQEIWANFTQFLGEAWANISQFFIDAWENVIQPVFQAIGDIFTWIYENIILPVVTGIMLYIGLWAALIQWLWETVLSPVFGFIGEIFTWLYENVIAPIIDGIVLYFQVWGAIFTWLWENVVSPVFEALGVAFTWIYENIIRPTIDAIVSAVEWVGTTIDDVFSGIADFIGTAFQAVLDVVRGPINGLIGLINSVIDGLNSISVDIPDWVPMVGGQTFGLSISHIPQLEDGALVKARTGGIIANIGEGRYDEMVVPLSPQVLGQLNGGGNGATVNVYPQPGMSEETVGRIAAERLAYQLRGA